MCTYNRLVKIANRKGAPDKARRKAEEARNRLGQVIAARDALVGPVPDAPTPPLDQFQREAEILAVRDT